MVSQGECMGIWPHHATPGQKWRIWACPHGRAASSLLGSKPHWIGLKSCYQIGFSKANPWDFEKIESWTGFSLLFTVFVLNLDFTCHLHETAFQADLHAALWLAQQTADHDTVTCHCALPTASQRQYGSEVPSSQSASCNPLAETHLTLAQLPVTRLSWYAKNWGFRLQIQT